jgi:hypothetical protein
MSWLGIRYSLRLLNEKARSRGRGSHQCCDSGPMRTISPYRFGRSPDWLKSKNPACEAVKREEEEHWGQ